jgi:hypothetical protein
MERSHDTKTILVGARGNVSEQVRKILDSNSVEHIVLSLAQLSRLSNESFRDFWTKVGSESDSINLVWISACTSNEIPSPQIHRVNFTLPTLAISELAETGQLSRVITLGTVLEDRSLPNNSYVASKKALSTWLANSLNPNRYLHIRTHTLVPLTPPPTHMFLGQLYNAARKKETFSLESNGRQLREYLDVMMFSDYVARSISDLRAGAPSIETVGGARLLSLQDVIKLVIENFASDLRILVKTDKQIPGEVYRECPILNTVTLPFGDPESLLILRFREWLRNF